MKSNRVIASFSFFDGSYINLTSDGNNYYIFYNSKFGGEFKNESEAKVVFYDSVDEMMQEKLGLDFSTP